MSSRAGAECGAGGGPGRRDRRDALPRDGQPGGGRPAGRGVQRDALLLGRGSAGSPPRASTSRSRRAAALGLPRRHPRRAGGRRLRGLRGDRLADRAAHRATATARSGRAWCSSGSTPTPTIDLVRPCRAADDPAAAPHGGVRRRRQQRRPQGRPPAADRRRPRLRRRPRCLLLRRGQAAHRAVAVARQAAAREAWRSSRGWSASSTARSAAASRAAHPPRSTRPGRG